MHKLIVDSNILNTAKKEEHMNQCLEWLEFIVEQTALINIFRLEDDSGHDIQLTILNAFLKGSYKYIHTSFY